MIDEQKLLDWLAREATDGTKPLVHRTAYRRLLSKIENGEFAPAPAMTRPGDVVWSDDDDLW